MTSLWFKQIALGEVSIGITLFATSFSQAIVKLYECHEVRLMWMANCVKRWCGSQSENTKMRKIKVLRDQHPPPPLTHSFPYMLLSHLMIFPSTPTLRLETRVIFLDSSQSSIRCCLFSSEILLLEMFDSILKEALLFISS